MKRLTRDKKTAYAVSLSALAASLLMIFVPQDYVMWATAAVLFVAAAFVHSFMKKRSIHSYNKRQVLLLISIIAALYITLYYLSGIEFGFVLPTATTRSVFYILKNVIPITAIVLLSEYIRTVALASESRGIAIIGYFIGVASAVACAGGIAGFRASYQLVDFVGLTLAPALTSNLLFNYLNRRYGMLPSLSYRLIIGLHTYVIPILSDVPKIFVAFVLLVLPLISGAFIDMLFEKKVKIARKRESKWRFVFPAIVVIVMVGVIMLVTCKFRFGALVIATESMSGEIEKGDVVVYESSEYCEEIEEGDVIVFEENGRRVVHRVAQIDSVNGQRQYITRGDANEGIDAGYRIDSDIVGIVRFKVIYIGYPSIWLRQAFEG